MPLPIQVAPSSCGGPILPLEMTRPWGWQDRLAGLEPPEVGGGGHGSSSAASLVGMVSGKAELKTDVPFTLDDGIDRINCIKLCYIVLPWGNWCKIYTKTISSPGLKPIDTLKISASCRCKVGWLVRVT
ncbi:uncharacterized protein LOC125522230 [Triticum urartu]|uniref:uncharacterized protein LOC125522230 n=1 Tax=Triticum urartu TaxID=4572 RepID=UPI002042F849|nr:uncharacterized protein LOC125522230 [Triticum urartu]